MTGTATSTSTSTMDVPPPTQRAKQWSSLSRRIDELEERLIVWQPWRTGEQSSVTAAIDQMTGCHQALQEVLQRVVEIRDHGEPHDDEVVELDGVIDWCVGVKGSLDRSFTTLVRGAARRFQ